APLDDAGDALACGLCGARHPRLGGVPILVANPGGFLASIARDFAAEAPPFPSSDPLFAPIAADLEEDRALVRELGAPVIFHLKKGARAPRRLDAVTGFAHGWSFGQLAPYLYRDWAGTAESRELGALLCGA